MNCASCGAVLPAGAMFCGNCGRAVGAVPVPRSRLADPRPADTTIIGPDVRATLPSRDELPDAGKHADVAQQETSSARLVQSPPATEPPMPFVLSSSTGERIVVIGAGLLGRRPFAQPGERFDQLVSIADRQRSVSKTHLEFGLENGDLWICDRYSANGTVIIPPAGAPRRLEPGRRYRVPRGGRVEIGDHWFDVR